MTRRRFLWVITIVWALGIFCLSAHPAKQSGQSSAAIAKKIVTSIPELHYEDKMQSTLITKTTETIIRKTAHGVLFFVLAIFVVCLLQTYPKMAKYAFVTAFLLCVLYAASDELHQTLIAGRSGRISDIAVDSVGSFLGLCNTYVISKLSPTS